MRRLRAIDRRRARAFVRALKRYNALWNALAFHHPEIA